ncbi:MAG: hypothetical protein AAF570_17900, partial [Bacteroidota bacterium]
FGPLARNDYRKINAIPYNHFFWNYNDEYSLNDRKGLNDKFYDIPQTLTNQNVFEAQSHMGRGLFERPYLAWSKERVGILKTIEDTVAKHNNMTTTSEKYNLEVKIFLDYNTYGDSTNMVTHTVFAPHESFYYLPVDKVTNCFVNIFFDLCEMERLRLEAGVMELIDTPNKIPAHVRTFQTQFKNKKANWIKEMNTGENKKAVIRYNKQVKAALKIDNMSLFKPYTEEEEKDE